MPASGASGYKMPLPNFVEKDVETLRQNALVVIELKKRSAGGYKATVTKNKNFSIMIIGVIGPGVGMEGTPVAGESFERAVLLEIGLGRSRPYKIAKGYVNNPNKKKKKWIDKRRKWFQLDPSQYKAIAETLFTGLQEITDVRIAQWKDRFWFNREEKYAGEYSRYSRRRKRMERFERNIPIERGVRYSVCPSDKLILADIMAAELRNPEVRERMKRLARFIDLRLDKYKFGFRGKFSKLVGARDVLSSLRRRRTRRGAAGLPDYLKREAIRTFLPHKTRITFNIPILQAMEWLDEKPREVQIAESALPQIEKRVNGTRLRVTDISDRLVVFELFKSKHKDQNESRA